MNRNEFKPKVIYRLIHTHTDTLTLILTHTDRSTNNKPKTKMREFFRFCKNIKCIYDKVVDK